MFVASLVNEWNNINALCTAGAAIVVVVVVVVLIGNRLYE